PATVRDPGPLLLVAGVDPAVRIEPVRFRVRAFVEQGGADAADSLVPPGNADAVEAALALHLAEEGDGQDGRDPARLLADAVEVPEPADGRQIRLAGGDFPKDLFARPRFDFPVAAEAAGKEREP